MILAEYFDSGGTRTYLKQLLDFYHTHEVKLTLVGISESPDDEVGHLLALNGSSYFSYGDVMSLRNIGSIPKVWSPVNFLQERKRFRSWMNSFGVDHLVVSAGTPGMFLGAASGAPAAMYILHTYPHGVRQKLLGRWLMNLYSRPVTLFIAVSEFQARMMETQWHMTARHPKVMVVRNSTGPQMQVKGDRFDATPMVLTASWLESYKEPLTWLSVAEEVIQRMGDQAPRFVWIGSGSMIEDVRLRSGRSPCRDLVSVLGHVVDVDPFYKSARCYLQVSSVENMSLSTIDALRYGLPSVVTDVGGLPEIIEDGVCGFVVPGGDVLAISQAVVDILTNESTQRRLALGARRAYHEKFSVEAWCAQMLEANRRAFPSLGLQSKANADSRSV